MKFLEAYLSGIVPFPTGAHVDEPMHHHRHGDNHRRRGDARNVVVAPSADGKPLTAAAMQVTRGRRSLTPRPA